MDLQLDDILRYFLLLSMRLLDFGIDLERFSSWIWQVLFPSSQPSASHILFLVSRGLQSQLKYVHAEKSTRRAKLLDYAD